MRSAAHVNWRDRQKMKPARPLFLISNETDWVWRRAEWWDHEQIAALLTIQSGLTQCDRAWIYFCKRHPIRQNINTFHHNCIGWWMIGTGSWFQFWGRFEMSQEFNFGHVQKQVGWGTWVNTPTPQKLWGIAGYTLHRPCIFSSLPALKGHPCRCNILSEDKRNTEWTIFWEDFWPARTSDLFDDTINYW